MIRRPPMSFLHHTWFSQSFLSQATLFSLLVEIIFKKKGLIEAFFSTLPGFLN